MAYEGSGGKSKVRSSKSGSFAKGGGSGKMLPKRGAGQQKPGVTSTDRGDTGAKFASGGSGHMVGKTGTKQATPA